MTHVFPLLIPKLAQSFAGTPRSEPSQRMFDRLRTLSAGPSSAAALRLQSTEQGAGSIRARKMIFLVIAVRSAFPISDVRCLIPDLCHLMTRAAFASTLDGIVKSICLAAFKVKVRANFVDCFLGTQVGSVTFEA